MFASNFIKLLWSLTCFSSQQQGMKREGQDFLLDRQLSTETMLLMIMIMILLVWQSIGWITNKVHCKLQKKKKIIQKYPTTVSTS